MEESKSKIVLSDGTFFDYEDLISDLSSYPNTTVFAFSDACRSKVRLAGLLDDTKKKQKYECFEGKQKILYACKPLRSARIIGKNPLNS
jgi:hypothetical protein